MAPQRKPIYSTREEDPELEDAISYFAVSLAERVDELQDLHSTADFDKLAELAGAMADEGDRLGYPLLASVARVVVDASRECKAEASEEALIEITRITQRIRQAHRGAA
jgi:hypothetical protein